MAAQVCDIMYVCFAGRAIDHVGMWGHHLYLLVNMTVVEGCRAGDSSLEMR